MAITAGGIGAGYPTDVDGGGRAASFTPAYAAGIHSPTHSTDYSSFTTPCPAGLSGAGRIRLPGDCSNVETN